MHPQVACSLAYLNSLAVSIVLLRGKDGTPLDPHASHLEQGYSNLVLSVSPSISHSEMELEGEMVGKVIRVYWGKEKTWFTGVVASFDMETKFHTVSYSDGDDEDIDMWSLDSDRPAWEISPFSEAYFGF